jgi:hypothetical protein
MTSCSEGQGPNVVVLGPDVLDHVVEVVIVDQVVVVDQVEVVVDQVVVVDESVVVVDAEVVVEAVVLVEPVVVVVGPVVVVGLVPPPAPPFEPQSHSPQRVPCESQICTPSHCAAPWHSLVSPGSHTRSSSVSEHAPATTTSAVAATHRIPCHRILRRYARQHGRTRWGEPPRFRPW